MTFGLMATVFGLLLGLVYEQSYTWFSGLSNWSRSSKASIYSQLNFPTAACYIFCVVRRTCFWWICSLFSISKAKLSEYSEKIEALASRLAASVVCFYCIDSFAWILSIIMFSSCAYSSYNLKRSHDMVLLFYLNLYLIPFRLDRLIIS